MESVACGQKQRMVGGVAYVRSGCDTAEAGAEGAGSGRVINSPRIQREQRPPRVFVGAGRTRGSARSVDGFHAAGAATIAAGNENRSIGFIRQPQMVCPVAQIRS